MKPLKHYFVHGGNPGTICGIRDRIGQNIIYTKYSNVTCKKCLKVMNKPVNHNSMKVSTPLIFLYSLSSADIIYFCIVAAIVLYTWSRVRGENESEEQDDD